MFAAFFSDRLFPPDPLLAAAADFFDDGVDDDFELDPFAGFVDDFTFDLLLLLPPDVVPLDESLALAELLPWDLRPDAGAELVAESSARLPLAFEFLFAAVPSRGTPPDTEVRPHSSDESFVASDFLVVDVSAPETEAEALFCRATASTTGF